MTNNEKGLAFEKKCLDKLAEIGFSDLRLTNNTDNGADIIGSYRSTVYVFQCKDQIKKQGNKCVQEVLAARLLYKGNRSAVISSSGFTASAYALAEANNCILIAADEFFELSDFPPRNYSKMFHQNSSFHELNYDIIDMYEKTKSAIGRTPKWAELDKHLRYKICKEYQNYGIFLDTIGDRKSSSKLSDEEVKKEYIRVRTIIGRTPTLSDVKEHSTFALNLFQTYPMTRLQRECGDRPYIERGITKETLIKCYLSLKKKLGHSPSIKELDAFGEYKASYYRRRWGSFDAFLKELNTTRAKAGLPKTYTKDELIFIYAFIKLIMSIKEENDRKEINHTVLEKLVYDGKCLVSPTTISKKFGTWQNFKDYLARNDIDSMIEKLARRIRESDISIFESLID